MLKINQTFVQNYKDLAKVEELNHADSFEFLPMAKDKSYQELSEEKPTLFLSIKVTDNNGEERERYIIENKNSVGRMLMVTSTNRIFDRHPEYTAVSISYKDSLNQYRSEGIFVNALVIPKDGKEISADKIKQIEFEMATELKLDSAMSQVNSSLKEEKTEINNDTQHNNNDNFDDINNNTNDNASCKDSVINDDNQEYESFLKSEMFESSVTEELRKDTESNDVAEADNISTEESLAKKTETPSKSKFSIFDNKPQNKEKDNSIFSGFDKSLANEAANTETNEKIVSSNISEKKEASDKTNSFSMFNDKKGKPESSKDIYVNSNLHNLNNQNPVEGNKTASNEMTDTAIVDDDDDLEKIFAAEKEELLRKQAAMLKELEEKKEKAKKEKAEREAAEKRRLEAERLKKEQQEKEAAARKLAEEKRIAEEKAKLEQKQLEEKKNSKEINKNTEKTDGINADKQTLKPGKEAFNISTDKETLEKHMQEVLSEINDVEECKIINAFYDGDIRIPDKQELAYKNATPDAPFLNSIDKYVPHFDIRELEGENPLYDIHEEDEGVQTSASKMKLTNCFNRTMTFFMNNETTSVERTLRGEIDPKLLIRDIQAFIERPESGFQIPAEDIKWLMNKIQRAIFSYYVLTPALNDNNISDIRVLAPDNINVKVNGDHFTANGLKFIDADDYMRFIKNLLIKNNVVSESPILVFTDRTFHPDYILRFNICLPSINSTRLPYLHIRKVPKKKTTLKKLMQAKMLDDKVAAYLLDKVKNSRGIVFSGPSASGKTTLMNALIDYIPKDKSILCIQESEELFSEVHPNAYFQHMLKDVHGNIVIGLSELGQNGLLCDSGYFIIGECKGSEVRDLLRASNTGHKCWCSVHAQSSIETIPRLADYVKYGSDYSLTEATRMLKDLEVIVYIQNFKVKEISEIVGYDDDKQKIIYRCIYKNPYFNF